MVRKYDPEYKVQAVKLSKEIVGEDEYNDFYGRMYQILLLKQPERAHIPSERNVYRVIAQMASSDVKTQEIPGGFGTDGMSVISLRKMYQLILTISTL